MKCNVASKSWRQDHRSRCGTRPERKYKNMASLFSWILFGFWVVEVRVSDCRVASSGAVLLCEVILSSGTWGWHWLIVPGTPFSRHWPSSISQQSPGACAELLASPASLTPLFSQVNGVFLLAFGHVKILGHSLWG